MAMDPNDDYTYKRVDTDGDVDTKLTRKGRSTAITVAIVAVVLAIVAFFVFNDDETDVTVEQSTSSSTPAASTTSPTFGLVETTKDAAAEVPQATKDATTSGDQSTTRPNGDGSTNNLDQK